MKKNSEELKLKSKRKWLKRTAAGVSALAMLVSATPYDAMYSFAEGVGEIAEDIRISNIEFPQELIDAVTEYSEGKYDGREVLETLYRNGIINEKGELISKAIYNIDGADVTEAELCVMATQHYADDEVYFNGMLTTWGEINNLLVFKEFMAAFKEYMDGVNDGTIPLESDERNALQEDLTEELKSRLAFEDGKPVLKAASPDEDKEYENTFINSTIYRAENKANTFALGNDGTINKDSDDASPVSVKLSDSTGTKASELNSYSRDGLTAEFTLEDATANNGLSLSYKVEKINVFAEAENEIDVMTDSGTISVGKDNAAKLEIKLDETDDVNAFTKYKLTVYCDKAYFPENGDKSPYLTKYFSVGGNNSNYVSGLEGGHERFDVSGIGTGIVDWSDYVNEAVESVKVDYSRTGKNGYVPVIIQVQKGYTLRLFQKLGEANTDGELFDDIYYDTSYMFMGLKYKQVQPDGTEKYYYATPVNSYASSPQIQGNYANDITAKSGVLSSAVSNYVENNNNAFFTYDYRLYSAAAGSDPGEHYKAKYYGQNIFDVDSSGHEVLTYLIPASAETYLVGLDATQYDYSMKCYYKDAKDSYSGNTYKERHEEFPNKGNKKYNLVSTFNEDLVGVDVTLFKSTTNENVYIPRNVVGDSSYSVKLNKIFDTKNITQVKINKDMNGKAGTDNWMEVRIPFRKKNEFDWLKTKANEAEYDRASALNPDLREPKYDNSEYTAESQQWIIDNVPDINDLKPHTYLKSVYVDDGYSCEDTKVYVHYVNEEEGSFEEADYIYFQVKVPYLPVKFSSTAYIHMDLYAEGTDAPKSAYQGKYYLPETELGIKYDLSEFTPMSLDAEGVYTKTSDLGTIGFVTNQLFGYQYDRVMKNNDSFDFPINSTKKFFSILANRVYGQLVTDEKYSYDVYIHQGIYQGETEQRENKLLPVNNLDTVKSITPMFRYSDEWQKRIDTEGDTNGICRTFWKNSFIDSYWDGNTAKDYLPAKEYFYSHPSDGSASDYVDLPTVSGNAYRGQAEADVPLVISEHDFNEMQTTENPYPIEISISQNDMYKAKVKKSLRVSDVEKYFGEDVKSSANTIEFDSVSAKDSNGFTDPRCYKWTVEFTNLAGKTTVINPDEKGNAVEFTVYNDDKGGHFARITNINENEEGTFRFVLRIANSIEAVNTAFGVEGYKESDLTEKDFVKLVSSPVTLIESNNPFLIVPSASKKITTVEGETANVLFNSNVQRKNSVYCNSDTTEFTIDVYECDKDGNITNNTPVYSDKATTDSNKSLTNFAIPAGKLTRVSTDVLEPVYKAIVRTSLAEEHDGFKDFSDSALIAIKEKPLTFCIDVDSPFFVNNEDLCVPYNVVNAEEGFNGYYTVVRMSDGKEIMKGDIPSGASTGSVQTIKIKKENLAIKEKKLKDKFSVNFFGRNSEKEEYSVGTTLLNVYNDGSLRIAVDGIAVENGDTHVISRRKYIETELLNTDGVTLNISNGISALQRALSITASAYVTGGSDLGGISDSITWSYEKEEDNMPIALYYILYGTANKLNETGRTFLPSINMMISGELDAAALIKAVHEKTGMTAEANVKIDDVENELFILQFFPTAKTEIEYTNAKGVKRNFTTNEKGQIAIYEPDGYDYNEKLKAHCEYNNGFYKNEFDISEFVSGSRDTYQSSFYPINSLQLHCGYAAAITIPEAKGKTVHIRGGAYKYAGDDMYNHLDTYCKEADLYDTYNTIQDQDGKSNGIEGIDIKADDTGMIVVYFDSNQIIKEGESEFDTPIGMAFEVSIDDYFPRTVEIPAGSCNSEYSAYNYATVNVDKIISVLGYKAEQHHDIYSQKVYYSSSGNSKDIDVDYIGYTQRSPETEFHVQSAFCGAFDDFIVKDGNNYSQLRTDNTFDVKYINCATKSILSNGSTTTPIQYSKSYVYQFSTIVNNNLKFFCSEENLNHIMEKDYFVQVNLGAYKNDLRIADTKLDYSIINQPDVENPLDPKEVKNIKKQLKDELEDIPSLFGTMNGDSMSGKIIGGALETIGTTIIKNNVVEKGMTQPVKCTFLPTADPMKFEILIGMGAEDNAVTEDKLDGNLSASLGAQFADYAKAEISTDDDDDDDDDDEYDFGGYISEGLEFSGADFLDEGKMNDTFEKFDSHKKEDGKKKNDNKKEEKKDNNSNEDSGKKEDGEEKKDDDNDAEFKLSATLYGIVSAEYNPNAKNESDKWVFNFKGLSAGANVEVEKKLCEGNAFVGPVPVTYSVAVKANASLKVSSKRNDVHYDREDTENGIGKYEPKVQKNRYMTLIDFLVGGGLEVYGGVGFDYELVALSMGVFLDSGIDINVLTLFMNDPFDFTMGIKGGLHAELGIKVQAKLFIASYETTICSVSGGVEFASDRYNYISNNWSGYGTKARPQFYNASSDQLQSMDVEQSDENTVLFKINTVSENIPALKSSINPADSLFEASADDMNKISDVNITDDGKLIVYLDDNVASFANGNGISSGAIITSSDSNLAAGEGADEKMGGESGEKLPELTDEEKAAADNDPATAGSGESIRNYGDYNLGVSGSNGSYFAAWSQQRNSTSKAANGNAEVNNADITIALNSTEIIVSAYKDGKWTSEKLTNNYQADISPKLASKGDKAVVVWETSSGSDTENILESDVSDMLMYSVYDGSKWSEAKVLYNGSFGEIGTFETAMADDGTTAVVYSLVDAQKTGDVFYSVIDADGEASAAVRATVSASDENNVKVTTVGNSFIMAWFDNDENDIMLMKVNTDETIDNNFPECVAGKSAVGMSGVFDICGGDSLDDFTVVWSYSDKAASEEDETKIVSRRSVYGAKICQTGEQIVITPAQLIDRVENNAVAANISAAPDGEGGVKYVITETIYGAAKNTPIAPEVLAELLLRGEEFTSEYAYQEAFEEKVEEIKNNPNSEFYTFLSSEETISVSEKDYKFINDVYIEDAVYDEASVVPGLETAMLLTVVNMGVDPVNSFKINETDEVILDAPLMPGESTECTYIYEVGKEVKDIELNLEADNGSKSTTGVYVDVPQPYIETAEIAKSENGIRYINMRIVNKLAVPFATSDKKLCIEIYSDEDFSKKFKTIEISNKDTLANIDSGLGNVEIEIDAAEYMKHCGITDSEIPENGMPVYIIATVMDSEGNRFENSAASLTIESRMTDRTNPLSITSIITKNEAEKQVVVDSVINNDSMNDQYLCNIKVQLFDEDGNLIAEKYTFDESITDFDTITKESSLVGSKYQIVFSLSDDEMKKVAYAESSAFNNTLNITYDMGDADDVENIAKTVTFGNAIKNDEIPKPESEVGIFEGWYADKGCEQGYDFTKPVLTDITLYAKWKLPNIDVSASGVFIAPDGSELIYDAENRRIVKADGTNPDYGKGCLEVDKTKISADSESNKDFFKVVWLNSDGVPINDDKVFRTGDYTVKISGTEEGKSAGVSGTLVIHVTIAPYVLTVSNVKAADREYDGTTKMYADETSEPVLNIPEGGLFHGDNLAFDKYSGTFKADKDFGKVKVEYVYEPFGDGSENYVVEPVTAEAEITPRKAELSWNCGSFGEIPLEYNESDKPEVEVTVANLVKGDKVTVEVEGGKAERLYTKQTATVTKLSGEDADKYTLPSGDDLSCKWTAKTDNIVLSSATLSLTGNIGVNIYAVIPDEIMADKNAYVTMSSPSSTEKVMLSDLEVNYDETGNKRYKMTHVLAAKEMNDKIKISFHRGGGNTIAVLNAVGDKAPYNLFEYSIADYINAVEADNKGTYSDTLVKLVEALKDYGSAVQTYFDYDVENKFELSDKPSEVKASDLAKYRLVTRGKKLDGISFRSASLVLESETSIRVYLDVDDPTVINTLEFAVNGEKTSVKEKDGLYYIEKTDISARNLDADYAFTVSDGTKTSEIDFNALSYADMVLSKYSRDTAYTDLCNVAKTLYLYSVAADNYFV